MNGVTTNMPTFTYVSRDTAGRPQRGTQEAASAAAVANSLRERGWLVVEVPHRRGARAHPLGLARPTEPVLLAGAALAGHRNELAADGGDAAQRFDPLGHSQNSQRTR